MRDWQRVESLGRQFHCGSATAAVPLRKETRQKRAGPLSGAPDRHIPVQWPLYRLSYDPDNWCLMAESNCRCLVENQES